MTTRAYLDIVTAEYGAKTKLLFASHYARTILTLVLSTCACVRSLELVPVPSMTNRTRSKSAPKQKSQRRRRSKSDNVAPVHSFFKPLTVTPAPEPKSRPKSPEPAPEKKTDDANRPPSDAEEEKQTPRMRRRSRRSLLAKKLQSPTPSVNDAPSSALEHSLDSAPSSSAKAPSCSTKLRIRRRQLTRNTIDSDSVPSTPPGDPALLENNYPTRNCVVLSSSHPSPEIVVSVDPPSPPALPRATRPRAKVSYSPNKSSTGAIPDFTETSLTLCSPFAGVSFKPQRRVRFRGCCSKCGAPAYASPDILADSPVSPEAEEIVESVDSDVSSEPIARSRLSLRGQRARRAVQRKTESKRKRAPEVVDVDADAPEQVPVERPISPKRRRKSKTSESSTMTKPTSAPPQKLHSFFAATQKAVASARTDGTSRKACVVAAHPWTSQYATIHVNAPTCDDVALPVVSKPLPIKVPDYKCISELLTYDENEVECETRGSDEASVDLDLTEEAQLSLWSELYKDCEKIDQINSTATASLVDWLRLWYGVKNDSENSGNESRSEDFSEFDEEHLQGADRIAILTGPPGCGKSTIIKVAARQLGLSILEINQSMCRSGKRVKDIVGEAMKSHRVTGGRKSFSFGKRDSNPEEDAFSKEEYSPRTLIVFEEVDELHDDEPGFWRMIRELVSAEGCMRPIVCTANKFNSTMQSMFGTLLQSDDVECVHRLLLPEPVEEQANTLGFKHIELHARSPRQVSSVLKAVVKRERLGLDRHILEAFSKLGRPGDVRSAINELQFCSTPFQPPSFVRLINSSAHILCGGNSNVETSLGLSRREAWLDDNSVLEGIYRGVTSQLTRGSPTSALSEKSDHVDDSLAAIADAMEAFVEADIIDTPVLSNSLDTELLLEDDIIPDAYLLDLRSNSMAIAADIRAQALISIVGTFGLEQMKSEKVARAATREIGALLHPTKTPLDLYGPTLGRRAATSDLLPALRVMAIGSRVARERAATDGQSDPTRSAATVSRLGRWTRSRTRGNHMHSLGLNEDAATSLELSCLVAKRLGAKRKSDM